MNSSQVLSFSYLVQYILLKYKMSFLLMYKKIEWIFKNLVIFNQKIFFQKNEFICKILCVASLRLTVHFFQNVQCASIDFHPISLKQDLANKLSIYFNVCTLF